MSTMKDIAQLSGCSLGTVDRALNHKPGVSAQTRERVLAVAKSLNYKPNRVGQKLVNHGKGIRLGAVLEPMENPFFQQIRHGVELASAQLGEEGVATDIYCMNTYKDTEMLALLEQLEESGAAGIVLNAINSPLIHGKLRQLHAKGIKLVTCSSDVDGCYRDRFVGFPHELSGRVGAELISKLNHYGQGRYLVLIGYSNILAHQQRLKGFRDKIAQSYPDAELVEVVETQENDEVAMKAVFDALTRRPEVNGVFITCYGIKGAVEAVRLKHPDNHIPIVCYDRFQSVPHYMELGLIDACICQNPVEQGSKALQFLYDCVTNPHDEAATEYFTKVDIRLVENMDL